MHEDSQALQEVEATDAGLLLHDEAAALDNYVSLALQ